MVLKYVGIYYDSSSSLNVHNRYVISRMLFLVYCDGEFPILQVLKMQRISDGFFSCLLFLLQIDLMVSGNQPFKAMSYIHDLKLFYVVFFGPPSERPKFEPAIPDICDR